MSLLGPSNCTVQHRKMKLQKIRILSHSESTGTTSAPCLHPVSVPSLFCTDFLMCKPKICLFVSFQWVQ